MQVQCQRLDRISALPEVTIEKILTLMPIRDALRTSILSKKWRYCWTRMPKLVFDDEMLNVSSGTQELDKYKLLHAIFHVLLLHRGPIVELRIWIFDTIIAKEIDQIILHLSWTKNIKKFNFESANERYKLPFSYFSLRGLELLYLTYCEIELPLMFDGFSMLKSLMFYEIKISFTMLQRFLTSCPLLEEFTLIGYDLVDFTRGSNCTFVELFKCLPSIQVVNISRFYIKHFTAGGVPMSQKLPTSLVYLRILILDVCFHEQDELSSTLCVINSSPNLEKMELKSFRNDEQTSNNLLDLEDDSGLKLDHLKELEITSFHNYAIETEFVKLVMAKSPVLKKARIELDRSVSLEEEVTMLRDLLHLPFPRASPAAKFIIERPRKWP